MNLFQSARIALRALAGNKVRATLTVLGIIIGIAAVISLISVGQGARKQITDSINKFGTNLLFVRPIPSSDPIAVQTNDGLSLLTYEDGQAIAQDADLPVTAVSAELTDQGNVRSPDVTWFTRISGTTPNYEQVRDFTIAEGSFFTQSDLDFRTRVVVLGPTVARQIFPNRDPIGQTVRIGLKGATGDRYRVVGVTTTKGITGFTTEDDQVIIPLSTMQQDLYDRVGPWDREPLSVLDVQVTTQQKMDGAASGIGAMLRQRHHVSQDDFRITSEDEVLQLTSQVTSILTIVLGAIAGISLLVGGIGIMNIMLVSVTERTREIGIRRAVGARRKDILLQFVVEAIFVSLLGGVLGVALGIGIAHLVSQVPVNGRYLQATVSAGAIVLAVGVSAGIGVFFGFFPALRAARLRPIESLRYE